MLDRRVISGRAVLAAVVVLALALTAAAGFLHRHDVSGRICTVCHFGPQPAVQSAVGADLPPLALLGPHTSVVPFSHPPDPATSARLPRAPPA